MRRIARKKWWIGEGLRRNEREAMGMEWNGREREGKGKGEGREREGKGKGEGREREFRAFPV